MSERISENTLDAFKQCAEMMENHSCRAEAKRTLLLVAEVRRLRGLISAGDDRTLSFEARAIREEQGR